MTIAFALLVAACSHDSHQTPGDAGADDADAGADAQPPEPPHACAGSAGALDPSAPTDIYDAAACLYTGPGAPQVGVDASAIERERVAIVRGKLTDPDGTGLGGATVDVAGHPEYGHTLTRRDGSYDLAVDGGGQLTLRFTLAGRIAAQRHVATQWRRFAVIPDVALVKLAAAVTVALSPSGAMIDGASSNDASGPRASAVFVQPGTTATYDAGAGPVTLTAFHLHTTELTVGDRGPSAMPGDLPATSAYTYAVEFTVDEAVAAGAPHVAFDPPVVHYVDNFLHFPVGTIVPNGTFDRALDAWQAGDNGVVLKIVSIDNGVAMLDADGDGLADGDAPLAALGITAAERVALGQRYAAGALLWRVPISHFSCWDHNWPFAPPNDATGPDDANSKDHAKHECKSTTEGSIIGCTDQSLGEVIAIPGTSLALHYQSERADGRLDDNQLDIQLSGASIPNSLKRIDAEVEVLGKVTAQSFPAQPNASWQFAWDRTDPYGRVWQGRQTATIRVGFVYNGVYEQTTRFGYNGNGNITGDMTRQEVTIWKTWEAPIGTLDSASAGLGGWTLSANHVFDAAGGLLAYGDGHERSAASIDATIKTAAGTGTHDSTGDGGPATAAAISQPHGIAVAPDGSVFFSEDDSEKIRKIAPDGTISTYAGTGQLGFAGDGGSALQASFSRPLGLALAPDGTLYIADGNNNRVRAISPQGTITTFAGGGTAGNRGDGGPATAAALSGPHALLLAGDGSLYIGEDSGDDIRRVLPDGTITTVATDLYGPLGLAIGAHQEIYVTEYNVGRVDRIDPGGARTVVIGLGTGSSEDGSVAATASIYYPHTVDLGPDGSLYVTEEGYSRVRRITQDGLVYTVAGGGSSYDDNVPALAAALSTPRVIHVHHDGTLWIADWSAQRIQRVKPSLPNYLIGETPVAASSGDEVYVFDDHGRHLRTLDARTGAVAMTFGYDARRRLTSATDIDGNAVTIERDAQGVATAIVSPFGVRTRLAYDAAGNLATVTDAAGNATRLAYASGGLLTSLTTPRGDVHAFAYDAVGRLTSDASPTGLVKTLTASGPTITTTLGGGTSMAITTNPDGSSTFVDPAGRTSTAVTSATQTTITTPTGTTAITYAGDPRFGMQAPYAATTQITSGSHSLAITRVRTATLRDATDPSSVTQLSEAVSQNGKTSSKTWDAAARTLTFASPAGRIVVETYDAKGHLIGRQRGNLAAESFSYDASGRLTTKMQGNRVATASFGATGFLADATDALGQTAQYQRDAIGRVTSFGLPDQSAVDVQYDSDGNLLRVTSPAGVAHQQTFAPGDLPAGYAASGRNYMKTYDGAGRPTSFVRPDGTALSIAYDAGGRIVSLATPGDTRTASYDASTGQLIGVAAASEQLAFGYDGGLRTQIAWSGDVTGTVSRELDDDFAVTAETAAGSRIAFGRDLDGLVTSAGALSLSRDAVGAVTATQLGTISESRTYDSYGAPASYAATGPAGALYREDLVRDALGRVGTRTETIGASAHTEAFAYDSRGRLTSVTRDGVAAGAWSWDADGNRTSAATYDAHGQLVALAGVTFVYDASGALISRTDASGATSFAYDGMGALTSATLPDGTAIAYVIDPLGRRIGKRVNGNLQHALLYSDSLHPAALLDANGQLLARFVYASRRTVPDYVVLAGTTYRLITDHLGSVRLVVDASTGAIVQQLDYDAWGSVTADSNPGFQPFGFAGGLYDPDTKLVRFGARDYDPSAGRFTTVDPSGIAGGLDVYLYADGDPVNRIDPSGHSAMEALAEVVNEVGLGEALSAARQAVLDQHIDWGDAGWNAAETVALLALGPEEIAAQVAGAAAINAARQYYQKGCIDWKDVGYAAAENYAGVALKWAAPYGADLAGQTFGRLLADAGFPALAGLAR